MNSLNQSCIDVFDLEIFNCKLHTITGIGKTLAAVIFSEIGGDISKFSSVPKLLIQDFILKTDSPAIPLILTDIFLNAARLTYDVLFGLLLKPCLHQFYERKRAEGKNHLNAMGQLLSIIFAVLRDNKPYTLT